MTPNLAFKDLLYELSSSIHSNDLISFWLSPLSAIFSTLSAFLVEDCRLILNYDEIDLILDSYGS